ncbi:MAG: NOB1 family endonuclease [Nitrososphaerales archaeon]
MRSSDTSVLLVLDATAFYAGIPFLGSSRRRRCYTTADVFDEVKHIKRSHQAIEALIDAGNLVIEEPGASYLRQAKELARKSGDIPKMSRADLSVIALALRFGASGTKVSIVTDDNAIANVAGMSGIRVSPVMGSGIRKVGRWIRYCSGCGRSYSSTQKICSVCGNRLRMRLRGGRTTTTTKTKAAKR